MQKVFIWGTGYWGEKCFFDVLPRVDVAGFVESTVTHSRFHDKRIISGKELSEQTYDYLILANSHEDEILRDFLLDEGKIIRYRERPKLETWLFSYQTLDFARQLMQYLSVECDGLTFLYNKTDLLIPNAMSFYQRTWSRDEMEFFWKMAPKRSKGIFMDIGANIGTTSIYFRSRLAQKLTYIAFDPVKENCKLLKINCILNNCEDIMVENIAISNQEGVMGLTVVDTNFGGSRVTDNENTKEYCLATRLDTYVREKNISPQDISYIWMDIEGHEADALEGAVEVLTASDASLFMEYNAQEYKTNEKLDDMLNQICSIYSSFICYEQYVAGKTQIRNICELESLANEVEFRQCNVLFLK